jgi:hypothetical protein
MTDAAVNPYAAPTVGPVPAPATGQQAMVDALGPFQAGRLLSLSRRIRTMGVCAGIVGVLQCIALPFLARLDDGNGMVGILMLVVAGFAAVMVLTAIACWWRPAAARWLAVVGGVLMVLTVIRPGLLTIPVAIIAIIGLVALFKAGRLYGAGRIHHASLARPRMRPRGRPVANRRPRA